MAKKKTPDNVLVLSTAEIKKLTKALDKLEGEFDDPCQADVFNYDNDFIDVEVKFNDGGREQYKLDRNTMEFKESVGG
jgi:hypothetical protein